MIRSLLRKWILSIHLRILVCCKWVLDWSIGIAIEWIYHWIRVTFHLKGILHARVLLGEWIRSGRHYLLLKGIGWLVLDLGLSLVCILNSKGVVRD
jgi:hypothetical protein